MARIKIKIIMAAREEMKEEPQIKKSPWLHAWSDPVAGIKAYSQSLRLADIQDDGESSLVTVDGSNKLKIYRGTNITFEESLPGPVTAIETFYPNSKKPMKPMIAVAIKDQLLLFFAHLVFQVPSMAVTDQEQSLWDQLSHGAIDTTAGCEQLHGLRDRGVRVSSLTVQLLSLETTEE